MPENNKKTGQFVKGQSGNPGGRPKLAPELSVKIRDACPHAIEKLIEFLDHKSPAIALKAAEQLLDRGYGKPMQAQNIELSGGLDMRAQIRSVLLEKYQERRIESQNCE